MPRIAGVDGCRAGWVVVTAEVQTFQMQAHDIRICSCFREVLSLSPRPAVVAIDIPIGLLDEPQPGGRACDRQARQLLRGRASSVFSPPIRALLTATQYTQVRSYGMSCQAFGILPKIREVDQLMTPQLQQRVYEAHPELTFRSLVGTPMRYNKKTPEGRAERLQALERAPDGFFRPIRQTFEKASKSYKRADVAPDDILDACVLIWTALRIANKQASRLPATPPVDQKELRMEMWY